MPSEAETSAGAPVAAPPATTAPAAAAPPAATTVTVPTPQTPASKRDFAVARKVLKQFGIKLRKDDEIEDRAAKYRSRTEEMQAKLAELEAKVPAQEAKLTAANAIVKLHAEQSLESLPEQARATVKAAAGDDPVKMLELIATTKAAMAAAAPPPAAAPATAPASAKPPVAQPASTSAATGTPTPASATPVNHRQVWESLREKNPFAAAQYANKYDREIFDAAQ